MSTPKPTKYFIRKQSLFRLFLLTPLLRPLWWVLVFFLTGDFKLYDSSQFVLLADNLLQHGVFSRSYSEPFFPDIARTPGYPLSLAVFRSFGSSLCIISFIQMPHFLSESKMRLWFPCYKQWSKSWSTCFCWCSEDLAFSNSKEPTDRWRGCSSRWSVISGFTMTDFNCHVFCF